MRATQHSRLFVRDDEETEVEVSFEFVPGTPESGNHGPPEHYDPGSGPEFSEIRGTLLSDPTVEVDLTEDEIDRFEKETMEDTEFDPIPTRDEY
jgi:hypothetical protein